METHPSTWHAANVYQSNLSFLLRHSCNFGGPTFPFLPYHLPPFSLLFIRFPPWNSPHSQIPETMAGLSIVLESQKSVIPGKTPQVISKTTISILNSNNKKPSSSNSRRSASQTATFLDQCFLCRKRLSPGNDIYMYKGDKAFCSEDCRCKQIFMDEEESIQIENCSLAALRPPSAASQTSPAPPRHRKPPGNRAKGGFAF